MVTLSYMASALVTGLLLLVVVVGMARWPNWRGTAAGTGGTSAPGGGGDSGVARGPAVAAVAALLLVVLVVALLSPGLAGGGAGAGGEGASEGVPGGAAIVAVGAGLGVLTVTYLVWGVYHSTRYRGLTSAQAAGVGAWVFGLLVIVGVLVLLLFG
jgi:hypothetical protein